MFVKPPGGWLTGTETAKLTAFDGGANAHFGFSVSISGDVAVVGARNAVGNVPLSGSAYVFQKPAGGWVDTTETAKLTASDGFVSDQFGFSVSISGDAAVVGAHLDDDNGINSGSAYVFQKPPGGWANMTQTAKLTASDGAAGDLFGRSASISGDLAVVGARLDDDNGNASGSAYVFRWNGSAWVQEQKLLASDGATGDRFGTSVAISGATAIVGAPYDDDNGGDSGSAYLFDAAAPGMCPWDLDGDGVVGVGDLLILVANFGPCDRECPADFDEDGFVGVSDLLALIANFGECPGTGCPWDVNGDGVVDRLDVIAVNDNMGSCKDPDNCPWDVNGDGVVNGADVSEVATHFGPCPKE